jgi:hypothetical protein
MSRHAELGMLVGRGEGLLVQDAAEGSLFQIQG